MIILQSISAITPTVRRQVIERVRLKAATFGQDLSSSGGTNSGGNSGGSSYKVRPEVVAALYEQWVMPLTKQVEVRGMWMGDGRAPARRAGGGGRGMLGFA